MPARICCVYAWDSHGGRKRLTQSSEGSFLGPVTHHQVLGIYCFVKTYKLMAKLKSCSGNSGLRGCQMPCSLLCSTVDGLCVGGLPVRMAGVSRDGSLWAHLTKMSGGNLITCCSSLPSF